MSFFETTKKISRGVAWATAPLFFLFLQDMGPFLYFLTTFSPYSFILLSVFYLVPSMVFVYVQSFSDGTRRFLWSFSFWIRPSLQVSPGRVPWFCNWSFFVLHETIRMIFNPH